jgi:hypothetical protein
MDLYICKIRVCLCVFKVEKLDLTFVLPTCTEGKFLWVNLLDVKNVAFTKPCT